MEKKLLNVIDFLNELHQRGFYKRLHIFVVTQEFQNHIDAFKVLVTVHFLDVLYGLPCPTSTSLTELGVQFLSGSNNIASLYPNLKRFWIYGASVDDIFPLIRHSRHLKEILVFRFHCVYKSVLNPTTLNAERNKLNGAEKLTIYVNERIYLATKWASKSINLDLIEIKRTVSYDPAKYVFNSNYDLFLFRNNLKRDYYIRIENSTFSNFFFQIFNIYQALNC